MTFLRTSIASLLLILPVHAQPTPTATDAIALISGDSAAISATLTNPTMYDIYVVSGTAASASSVDFVQGEKVLTSLTIPAFGSLDLQPAATHVRVSGLKGQLKEGDELTLTLETDGGVAIAIAAVVKATKPD